MLALLILSLFWMTYIEILAVQLRISGALFGIPNFGFHISTIVLLASRVFTAISLVSIGYLVDMNVSPKTLAFCYVVVGTIVFALVFLSRIKRNLIPNIFLFLHRVLHKKTNTDVRGYEKIENMKLNGPMIVIGLFSYFGFLLPSLLAANYPFYRATLLQFGFVFNSISTIIGALIVERRIAIICEEGNKLEIASLMHEYGWNRMSGVLVAAILFLIFLLSE